MYLSIHASALFVLPCAVGTKNVAKELRKICRGIVHNRDVTWFTQLSDKGKYMNVTTYNHL